MTSQELTTQPTDPVAETLELIYGDPCLFAEHLLGIKLDAWQARFLKLAVDHPRIAARSGHGVGKTATLAILILWLLLTRIPIKIVCTAPTSGQLEDALWKEIAKWNRRLPPPFNTFLNVSKTRVERVGAEAEVFAVARTTSKENPEALQGIHEENVVLIVDEASGVDDLVFSVAESSLTTKGSRFVMTGNPTRSTGFFYDAFHKMAHMWKTMRVSSLDAVHSRDGSFIESVKARRGIASNEWRVRILGEFPLGDDDTLIARYLVESAAGRDVETHDTPVVWGLDVARFGPDLTVLAKRQGNALLEPPKWWSKADTMTTANRIQALYRATPTPLRPVEICVDVIGLGAGVVDRLLELGLPVCGVNVGESAASKDEFMRLRDELWDRAREWFASQDCKIPNLTDDEGIDIHEMVTLVAELCSPRVKFTDSGKLKVESKDDLKRRGIDSPNFADAFCLSLYNTATKAEKSFFARDLAPLHTKQEAPAWLV